ncbi:hypothetical protein ACTWPB_21140 [Nocardia sp. IBHARD005]|uniref:hypothetical protein n=1 Tax=Nocardia sp. IBHARD005 TaxID=3457765 RepID=UPI0040597C08
MWRRSVAVGLLPVPRLLDKWLLTRSELLPVRLLACQRLGWVRLPATRLRRIRILAHPGLLPIWLLPGPRLSDHCRWRIQMLAAAGLSRSGLLPLWLLSGPGLLSVRLLATAGLPEGLPEHSGRSYRMLPTTKLIRPLLRAGRRLRAVLRSGGRLFGRVAGRPQDGGVGERLCGGVSGGA